MLGQVNEGGDNGVILLSVVEHRSIAVILFAAQKSRHIWGIGRCHLFRSLEVHIMEPRVMLIGTNSSFIESN